MCHFFYNSCRNQPYFDRFSLNIFFRQAVSFLLKFLFYSLEPKYLLQFERNNQVFNMKHLFPRFIILYQYMFDLWNNRSLIFQSVKNQGLEVPLSIFIVLLVFSLYIYLSFSFLILPRTFFINSSLLLVTVHFFVLHYRSKNIHQMIFNVLSTTCFWFVT